MGNKTSTLTKYSDMKINAINLNEAGNLGLVNRYKILLRQLSGSLYFILENNVSRTSNNSFQTKKSKFIYTDDRSEQKITCGLTLFMMALQVTKPHLVINHQAKERKMEDLKFESCEKNVCTYLTNMQEMRN